MAWHPMGWAPSFFSEIEAFPCAVLQHHYPDVPLHGDFTTIQDGDYEPVDLIVGGTPCQSFSNAGLRRGLDDPRGNLMLGYGAIAERLRPTWLVWENVPGVLSSNGGRDFGTFLGMLAKLGYGFAYRILDAQYFGLAQRRRRVFVVGYLGDWRPPAAVLFEHHSLSGDPAPSREARQDVTGTLNARTSGGGGLGTDFECQGGLQPTPILEPGARTGASTTDPRCGSGIGDSGDPMFTLQAGKQHGVCARMRGFGDYEVDGTASTLKPRDAKDATDLVCVHGTQDPLVSDKAFPLGRNNGGENVLFRRQPLPFDTTQITSSTNRCRPQEGAPCHPLAAGAHPPAVCFTGEVTHALDTCNNGKGSSEDGTGRGVPTVSVSLRGREGGGTAELGDSAAGTLRAAPGGSDKPHILSNMAVRRLTPREAERLQGFPDDFTKVPYRGKSAKQCPDGPRYKALGNSMAVPVMAWIGNRIEQVSQILAQKSEAA